MNIIFVSAHTRAPSFQFCAASLRKINDSHNGTQVVIKDDPKTLDYSSYDVALFMGYDQAASYAKVNNPSIVTGVFDPRGSQMDEYEKVDFIAVNDIIAKDYFSKFSRDVIVYYTYPEVPNKLDCPVEKKQLVLGYHGNPIHLDAMYPRITKAITSLAKEHPIELWAMYNIKKHGRWQKPARQDLGFPVKHIQYCVNNYARYMAHVDVGLVPQFATIKKELPLRLFEALFGEHRTSPHEYVLRFKETTNIGRHLVFAQYGIPVVSDMSPSACAFVEDGEDSFVAFHTSGWYRAIGRLISDNDLRVTMGKKLREKYYQKYSHDKLNANLISFLRKVSKNRKSNVGSQTEQV